MTNPSTEQIEAATLAMEEHYDRWSGPDEDPPTYAGLAEAALVAAAGAAPRAEYHRGYQEGLLQAGMAMQAIIDAGELVAAAGVAPSSELLCPLHHDGDSSTRNRADERTDNNLVDESPDRQTCNKPGNDGHDHFRSVHNAQRSNGADSSTPGVTPQGGNPSTDDREAIVEALIEDAWEGHDAELDREQLDLIAGTVIDAGFTRATPAQVDEAKLAEVLAAHEPHLDQTACYMGCCACGAEPPEDQIHVHVAHAVAEWLRGGGR